MYATFPLTLVSWVLLLGTQSVVMLYVVRFLQGLALGIVFGVAPIYVAEIADPNIRGTLSGYFQTMFSAGMLYAYVTGPFLSYTMYAYICAALTLLFFVTFIWMPETPYYLVMAGKTEKARESLSWLRGKKDVDDELKQITSCVVSDNKEKKGTWLDLLTDPAYRRALIVITSVSFVKMMSGVSAITTYITDTLNESGDLFVAPHYITIIIGVMMLLSNAFSAYLTDALGRKPLLYLSTIGAILFNAIAGTYFLLQHLKFEGIEDYNWIAYGSIAAYCVVGSIGLNPLVQTLQAELFPSNIRGLAGAYTTFIGTIFVFVALKQYKTVADAFGVYMNYFLFSGYSIVGSIGIFFFMKETAGKSLGEISG